MTVNFQPWDWFFDFPFRSYSCFRKKIPLTAQKVFPLPTVGAPSASNSPSARIILILWNISPHILFDFSLLICTATYMLVGHGFPQHRSERNTSRHSSRSTAAWLSCPKQTACSQSQSWFPKLLFSVEKIESPVRTVELVNQHRRRPKLGRSCSLPNLPAP